MPCTRQTFPSPTPLFYFTPSPGTICGVVFVELCRHFGWPTTTKITTGMEGHVVAPTLVRPSSTGRWQMRQALSRECFINVTVIDRFTGSNQHWHLRMRATSSLWQVYRQLMKMAPFPKPQRGRFTILKRLNGPIPWKHTMLMRLTVFRHVNLQLTSARGGKW